MKNDEKDMIGCLFPWIVINAVCLLCIIILVAQAIIEYFLITN